MRNAKGWDSYWLSQQNTQALAIQTGYTDPLELHWQAFFNRLLSQYTCPVLLELACGNGAVINTLPHKFTDSVNAVGLDISVHGIANLLRHHPQCSGVVASADALPFQQQRFDLVVSQFGAEYAGHDALLQALPLLREKGVMAAVVHFQGSDIYKASLQACNTLEDLRQRQILAEVKKALLAATGCAAGDISNEVFREADKAFVPVVRSFENIIRACRHQDLGNKLKRLYGDIARIYKVPDRYLKEEISQWMDRITEDFDAYYSRMKALADAALSEPQLDDLKQHICASDYRLLNFQPLITNKFCFGWDLVCQRTAGK
jgi:SAM-dependent methyltransferase